MLPVAAINNDARVRPCRVLVCEDSTDLQIVMSVLLTEAGYEVVSAEDGAEALRLIKEFAIDLLLLDLSLPSMDGFGILDYLYEHRPGLPVIVVTGLPPEEIEPRLAKMRRSDLPPMLLKPFETAQLMSMVEFVLDQPEIARPPSDDSSSNGKRA